MLLMGLEPTTAAALLRSAEPETVTQIAAELAYLQAGGSGADEPQDDPIKEFCEQLRERTGAEAGGQFVRTVLQQAVGSDRSRQIMGEINSLVEQRDPFLPIRSAEAEEIAEALAGESPHVAGIVLSELPSKTSAKLLPLLDDDVRAEAVHGMASERAVAPETRLRVATVVRQRLTKAVATGGGGRVQRDKQLRKVALLLRTLGSDLRSTLLEGIAQGDNDTSERIQQLMVVWDDIPVVSDRSLQEALRAIDSRRMALAMIDVDERTNEKLRSNMSERQAGMLDEEASLLSQPTEEEIEAARNELLQALRDLAANNFLTFEDD